jgi:thiol:disulfide interchange protein
MTLRRVIAVGLLASALVGCGRSGGGAAGSAAGAIPWEKDLAGALARAGSENKLVMVDFYTDWCRWCQVMDEKTFSNEAVQTELKRMVVVKLDAERDGRDAARRYRVDGFPTMLFLDAKGQEVGRVPGYLPPEPFLEELADVLKPA